MTERIAYEHIDEQIVGRRLVGVQHTGDVLSTPDMRQLRLLNDELISDPPLIALIALAVDGVSIAIGLGVAQRGLDAPGRTVTDDEAAARRSTPIDDRPTQGYEREVGVGPGGWIEVVE